jgi:hypothetical protein
MIITTTTIIIIIIIIIHFSQCIWSVWILLSLGFRNRILKVLQSFSKCLPEHWKVFNIILILFPEAEIMEFGYVSSCHLYLFYALLQNYIFLVSGSLLRAQVEVLVLVEASAVVPLYGQWLSSTEGSTCIYLLDRRALMGARWDSCTSINQTLVQ